MSHPVPARRRPVAGLVGLVAAGLVAGVVAGLAGCRSGSDTSPGAFCASVGTVPVITSADQLQGEGGQATLKALEDALRRLRSKAPADVRDDVATLTSVTAKLADALRKTDADPAGQAGAAAGLEAPLAAFQTASERIVQYTEQTCGIELGTR